MYLLFEHFKNVNNINIYFRLAPILRGLSNKNRMYWECIAIQSHYQHCYIGRASWTGVGRVFCMTILSSIKVEHKY